MIRRCWNRLHTLPILQRPGVRFILAGGVNTLVGYLLYAVFVLLHFPATLALLCATILGVIFNFFSIGGYVFRQLNRRFILRFVGVYAFTFCINASMLNILLYAGMHKLLAQALLVPPMALLAYLLHRNFVFGRKN